MLDGRMNLRQFVPLRSKKELSREALCFGAQRGCGFITANCQEGFDAIIPVVLREPVSFRSTCSPMASSTPHSPAVLSTDAESSLTEDTTNLLPESNAKDFSGSQTDTKASEKGEATATSTSPLEAADTERDIANENVGKGRELTVPHFTVCYQPMQRPKWRNGTKASLKTPRLGRYVTVTSRYRTSKNRWRPFNERTNGRCPDQQSPRSSLHPRSPSTSDPTVSRTWHCNSSFGQSTKHSSVRILYTFSSPRTTSSTTKSCRV